MQTSWLIGWYSHWLLFLKASILQHIFVIYFSYIFPIKFPSFLKKKKNTHKKAISLAFLSWNSYLMTQSLPTLPCNAYKLLWYLPLDSVEEKKCHLNVIQLFLKGIYNFNMVSRVYIELYILFCLLLNTGNTSSLYA